MSLPWTKFFPADWLADDGLRSVSMAARGLWIDLICLMLRSPKRGYLLSPDGKPMPPETIARRIGAETTEVRMALVELQSAQVFSLEGGVIISRRIVRETRQRAGTSRRVGRFRNAHGNGACNAQNNGVDEEARGSEAQRPEAQMKKPEAEKIAAAPLAVAAAKPASSAVDSAPVTKIVDAAQFRPPPGAWGKVLKGGIVFDPAARRFIWAAPTQADLDRVKWREAYPAVDIDAEMRKAAEWCFANPAEGRKSDYRKFLTGWLSRTQDRGGTRNGHHPHVVTSHADRRRAEKRAAEFDEPEAPIPIFGAKRAAKG